MDRKASRKNTLISANKNFNVGNKLLFDVLHIIIQKVSESSYCAHIFFFQNKKKFKLKKEKNKLLKMTVEKCRNDRLTFFLKSIILSIIRYGNAEMETN